MNTVYAHLVLNHAPLFILIFSLGLQVYYFQNGKEQGFSNGLKLNIINLLLIFMVLRSGELSEIALDKIHNIDQMRIDVHSEIAYKSFYLLTFLGILSLLNLAIFKYRGSIPIFLKLILVLSSFVSLIMISYTVHLGALIRHPEIREIFG